MSIVRPCQIALRDRSRSTSSSVSGKVAAKSRAAAVQPTGRSAIIPPTRVTEVVIRPPVYASCRL